MQLRLAKEKGRHEQAQKKKTRESDFDNIVDASSSEDDSGGDSFESFEADTYNSPDAEAKMHAEVAELDAQIDRDAEQMDKEHVEPVVLGESTTSTLPTESSADLPEPCMERVQLVVPLEPSAVALPTESSADPLQQPMEGVQLVVPLEPSAVALPAKSSADPAEPPMDRVQLVVPLEPSAVVVPAESSADPPEPVNPEPRTPDPVAPWLHTHPRVAYCTRAQLPTYMTPM